MNDYVRQVEVMKYDGGLIPIYVQLFQIIPLEKFLQVRYKRS